MSGPLRGAGSTKVFADGFFDPKTHPNVTQAKWFFILPGYFETLDIPILKGRGFHNGEVGFPFQGVIINETMAKHFWAGENPLEKSFYPWGKIGEDPVKIIGICKDFMLRPWEERQPTFFLAEAQSDNTMYIRYKSDEATIRSQMNEIVRNFDNRVLLKEPQEYSDFQKSAFRDTSSTFFVISVVAFTSLLISFCGTFYMTKNFVRNSQKDMSIQLAIGAKPLGLLWFSVRRCLLIVVWGLLTGVVITLVSMDAFREYIPGTESYEYLIIFSAACGLMLIAFSACYFPSRSILKIHPSEILREL